MLEIVLHEPSIPPNTGSIMRLCANTGCRLHLVEPLGFDLSERRVRRAGLDYRDMASTTVHPDWAGVRRHLSGRTWYAATSRATRAYSDVKYRDGDVVALGTESSGLPSQVLAEFDPDHRLLIPMRPGSRSLNLSNAASVIAYEGWRQLGFDGAATPGR